MRKAGSQRKAKSCVGAFGGHPLLGGIAACSVAPSDGASSYGTSWASLDPHRVQSESLDMFPDNTLVMATATRSPHLV